MATIIKSYAMTAIIPLIQEFLPMIMPSQVEVTPSSHLDEDINAAAELSKARGRPTPRVIRQGALVNCAPNMCASVLVLKPHSSSNVFHNGEHDAIITAISGTALLLTLPDIAADEPTINVMTPGSFAFIPPWTEHRAVNEGDEEARWSVVQNGTVPVVVELDGWAGDAMGKGRGRRERGMESQEDEEEERGRERVRREGGKRKDGWVIVRP